MPCCEFAAVPLLAQEVLVASLFWVLWRSGDADVQLVPIAVAAIRRHLAHQAEQRLALGVAWGEGNEEWRDLVFTDETGRPLDGPHRVTRDCERVLKAAALPAIRLHDLRHTCATILLRKGLHLKIVSELLGHASVAITMDVYSHYIPTMQGAAVEAMSAALGVKGDGPGDDARPVDIRHKCVRRRT